MKTRAITLAVLALVLGSFALAEDFKTVTGKIYKDATISRVEADGIILRTKTGISKVYFVELPKDIQERFHYAAAMPVSPRRQPAPIKAEPKPTDSPRVDNFGWVGALPVSTLFLRLLFLGTLIITVAVAFIIRRCFY